MGIFKLFSMFGAYAVIPVILGKTKEDLRIDVGSSSGCSIYVLL